MRSAFFGIHVATSGLNTARGNLNVTSHNIANSQLPGFSRQVAQMQAARPLTVGSGRGMYGTGSQITSVIQIRDRFLDRKFWHQSAIQGQFTAVNTHLSFVETVFNQIPNVGVMRTFNNFFSTMHDLTTRAHEATFRTNVATQGHSLAEQVRQNAYSLQRQQRDLNREFADIVVTINSLGTQIADLNRQIHIFERDGSNANDLRDQRALLIDQLSQLVNISVEERDFSRPGMDNDRRLTILINGYDFINHTRTNLLELVARNIDDPRSGGSRNEMDVPYLYDIFIEGTGSRFNIHSSTLSGKLRGIVDVRDGNGGQVTVLSRLTGQSLVQTQLEALARTSSFLTTGIAAQFAAFSGTPLDTHIANRDTALGNINGMMTPPPPPGDPAITSTLGANAWLSSLRSQRDIATAALPTLRSAFLSDVGFAGIRASVAAAVPAVTLSPPDILTTIQNHLNTLPTIDADGIGGFMSTLAGHLGTLAGQLDSSAHTEIISTINDAIDRINNTTDSRRAALQTSLTNIETLNGQITTLSGHITVLTTAVNGITAVTNFAERIELQLDWAIGNVQEMIDLLTDRIDAIEAGREAGDVSEYETFRAELTERLELMQAARENVDFPLPISPYEDDFSDFIAEITNALTAITAPGGVFPASIGIIENAAADLLDTPPITVTPTTNFKGIPFYMNQLNQLIRTFARGINEGRNRNGDDIPGAIGHIFGFDDNGENRNALFFTFTDDMGNAALVDNEDPFRSLRLWILANPDGTPMRDPETNEFITVRDPNPPVASAGPPPLPGVARDESGRPLFTLDYSQLNALNFILNPELLQDPRLLAASSNANVGQSNNNIIHGFLTVGNDRSLFNEGRLIDFIIATSNHLAVDNHQSLMFRESYEEITTQTHNHRLSVKSVDTEEEMLNLVRFQNMFIAASRLINVLDTVYDTLINRLGNF